jgi:hypothetical protein
VSTLYQGLVLHVSEEHVFVHLEGHSLGEGVLRWPSHREPPLVGDTLLVAVLREEHGGVELRLANREEKRAWHSRFV